MLKLFRPLLALLALCASQAFASEMAFDAAKFEQLQKQNQAVLLDAHADWCPTCKAQAPILRELFSSAEFKNLTLMRVDYDQDSATLKRFGITRQSTLVLIKGGKEIGRSLGDTQKDSIAALLRKGL